MLCKICQAFSKREVYDSLITLPFSGSMEQGHQQD